jgi:hypothetical protein
MTHLKDALDRAVCAMPLLVMVLLAGWPRRRMPRRSATSQFAERDYAFLETEEGEYRLGLCQRASATDLLRRVLAVLRLTVGNCRCLSKISGAACLSDVSLICRDQKTK